MNASRFLLPSVAALFSTSFAGAQVQTAPSAPEATRTVAPTTPGGPVAQKAKVAATIKPLQEDGKITGMIGFFPAGNSVGASGRIEGLETNRRYRVVVDRLITAPEGESAPPSRLETSNAGQPQAGAPNAGQPTSDGGHAGPPDGNSKPGVAGSGGQGTTVSGSRSPGPAGYPSSKDKSANELGVLSSDAKGAININTTLVKATLDDGPTTILNCTVTIWREPAGTSETLQVATGVIEAVKDPVITPPTATE